MAPKWRRSERPAEEEGEKWGNRKGENLNEKAIRGSSGGSVELSLAGCHFMREDERKKEKKKGERWKQPYLFFFFFLFNLKLTRNQLFSLPHNFPPLSLSFLLALRPLPSSEKNGHFQACSFKAFLPGRTNELEEPTRAEPVFLDIHLLVRPEKEKGRARQAPAGGWFFSPGRCS